SIPLGKIFGNNYKAHTYELEKFYLHEINLDMDLITNIDFLQEFLHRRVE
ncbi:4172_t:CDS:1, partial [Gigaspora rosea]